MSARDGEDPDRDLWAAYAQRVKRTASRKSCAALAQKSAKPSPTSSPALTLNELTALSQRTATQRCNATPAPAIKPFTFDRTTERQLRDGSFSVEARIDLHGMTQKEAHSALARFVTAQRKLGHRKLLVITGKGRGREGVLRTNLVAWLETLDEAKDILTVRMAAIRHGGDGAFYVLLKKTRAE